MSRQQLQKAEEGLAHIYTTLGITATVTPGSTTFIAVPAFIHQPAEPEQYYFHPDHLGSSNYITNIDGTVSQHMEYFAFGETFVEEHKNSHNSPYKYNSKELDEETGWYYYGARYYDPKVSLWLGVDPMAEKYPGMSPYNYCANNPIVYVDPDGKDHYLTDEGVYIGKDNKKTDYVFTSKTGTFRKDKNGVYHMANSGLTQIKDNEGKAMSYTEFNDLAGTLYAEATKGNKDSCEESAAIYSVLENRGNSDGVSTHDEAQTGGVNGWSKRDEINSNSANKRDVQNAYKGLIKGTIDSKDYSGGAYYWDGTDYSTTPRYTDGTKFAKSSHNLWNLKDNAKAGKNIYGTWESVYKTTNAVGKTTFSSLTDQYLNTRYRSGTQVNWKGVRK